MSEHYDETNEDTDLSIIPVIGSHEERLAQMANILVEIKSP